MHIRATPPLRPWSGSVLQDFLAGLPLFPLNAAVHQEDPVLGFSLWEPLKLLIHWFLVLFCVGSGDFVIVSPILAWCQ